MPRAVTAIYRSLAAAALVREELERLGLARHAVTILPEDEPGSHRAAGGTAVGTPGGAFVAAVPPSGDVRPPGGSLDTAYAGGLHADAFDRLHDLHLPEEDTRIYQEAIRNGDVVVSVEVGDDADLARIQEVMRRPEEARDFGELAARAGGADFVPRRHPLGPGYDSRWAGRPDEAASTPQARAYARDAALAASRRGG